jgi:hypothetical protein
MGSDCLGSTRFVCTTLFEFLGWFWPASGSEDSLGIRHSLQIDLRILAGVFLSGILPDFSKKIRRVTYPNCY